MLIKDRKTFRIGIVFAVSFIVVFVMIFAPFFGGKNGLQYADDSFNKLSKGSSYFIPGVMPEADKFTGADLSVTISLDSAEDTETAARLFSTTGARADISGTELTIQGDLGVVLLSALNDADAMYKNNGEGVSGRYGMNEKEAMKSWWTAFGKIEKKLKKGKLVKEAKIVAEVTKKGIEPAYNFYEIEANNVVDHAGMMSGLLVFYVAYTMWWGFAIFYLFEGIGLSMKKAKVKKEA